MIVICRRSCLLLTMLGLLPQVRKDEDLMATSIICMTIHRKLISSGYHLYGKQHQAMKTGGNLVFEIPGELGAGEYFWVCLLIFV